MKPTLKFIMKSDLKVEDDDGNLTPHGMSVAEKYAQLWIEGKRDLVLEREYEDLAGLFYDIRTDSDLARRHATPAYAEPEVMKSETIDLDGFLKTILE